MGSGVGDVASWALSRAGLWAVSAVLTGPCVAAQVPGGGQAWILNTEKREEEGDAEKQCPSVNLRSGWDEDHGAVLGNPRRLADPP